jgi:hypothetical protein
MMGNRVIILVPRFLSLPPAEVAPAAAAKKQADLTKGKTS